MAALGWRKQFEKNNMDFQFRESGRRWQDARADLWSCLHPFSYPRQTFHQ